MDSFTIKDLENLSGVKAHTIRIWEQRYQFLKPCRTCTNIRYYSNEELKKLLNIALLNKHGYKISHINKMCEVEVKEKILTLSKLEAQQETIINDLVQCMVELDLEKLENILEDHISLNGIEKTITQVIFPLLKKIGILWITNCINPAQEHLVSNIIRQKLIVGIDRISTSLVTDKKVLLFLQKENTMSWVFCSLIIF
ncbi:MAG: MerR family transcriptional regulator [Ferruginibacter sp.]